MCAISLTLFFFFENKMILAGVKSESSQLKNKTSVCLLSDCCTGDCGTPAPLDHSSVTLDTDTLLGHSAVYTCQANYNFRYDVTEVRVTCQETGWEAVTKQCVGEKVENIKENSGHNS